MELTRKPGNPVWLVWHALAAISLVLLPGLFVFGKTLLQLSTGEIRFLGGLVAAYLVCVLLLGIMSRGARRVSLQDILLVTLAVFGVYFFTLLLTGAYFSRPVLLIGFLASIGFILLSFDFAARLHRPLVIIAALALLASHFLGEDIAERLKGGVPGPSRFEKIIGTEFYDVRAVIYRNLIDDCPGAEQRCGPPTTTGGGISTFNEGYLLATGKGELYYLKRADSDGSIRAHYLPVRIPLNTDAFRADNGETDVWLYRVTDILVQDRGKDFRLFAAHHHWDSENQCSFLRISSLEGDYAGFVAGKDDYEWRTVYDPEPCLPVVKGRRGDRFKGADSGGRMALLDDSRILYTVGDYQVDGWNREDILAQDPESEYGKTILINLDTGEHSIYSSGHRNPQGLFVGSDGRVWLTEHGPRGGDELNLVEAGENYGWPWVTYGTEYGEKVWPLSRDQSQHTGFRRPVFAWIPSIAVSNLVGVEHELFPLWKGDLLVGSYKQSLWRLRIREGRVVYLEPIRVLESSGRIRDIMEDHDGRIVLWLDGGSLAVLEPLQAASGGEGVRGQVLYVQCAGCHNIRTGGGHPRDSKEPGVGPDLLGIVGSDIADTPGYAYSPALLELDGTWTQENLDAFLRDPQAFAPGNLMHYPGIQDDADRAALISYLSTLK